MDQVSGNGIYPRDRCFCAKCERAKGKRSRELWEQVEVPDYSVLLTKKFWMREGVFTGTSASDTNEVLSAEEKYFAHAKAADGEEKKEQ